MWRGSSTALSSDSSTSPDASSAGNDVTESSSESNKNEESRQAGWWVCDKCTYLNTKPDAPVCKLCNELRVDPKGTFAAHAAGEAADGEKNPEQSWSILEDDNDLEACDPPPMYSEGEIVEVLMMPVQGAQQLTWEPFASTHHQFYSYTIDDNGKGGACVIGRIRQNFGRKESTRWRIPEGRGGTRKRKELRTYAEEQAQVAIIKDSSPQNKRKKSPSSAKSPNRPKVQYHDSTSSATSDVRSAIGLEASDITDLGCGDAVLELEVPAQEEKTPMQTKKPNKPFYTHYVEQRLGMAEAEIVDSLPAQIREEIHNCIWVSREGRHHPALILTPFDISGKSEALDLWLDTYKKAAQPNASLDDWKVLVYWYCAGYSRSKSKQQMNFKGFGLMPRSKIVQFSEGIRRKYDTPTDIAAKIAEGQCLTPKEDALMNGIEMMKTDYLRDKGERGGEMFFEHMREEKLKQAESFGRERERQRVKWRLEQDARRQKRREKEAIELSSLASSSPVAEDESQYHGGVDDNDDEVQPRSLELCAGEARMSSALLENGFIVSTLDNSSKKPSDSSLSLEQLEARIEDGTIKDHPFLDHSFNFIWAGPDCRTWSKAASMKVYRTDRFIYGIPNTATETEALQAEKDIDSLINILKEYLSRKPGMIMCIENPDMYLPKHSVSKGFKSELGLAKVKISYCCFGNRTEPWPRKNTVLWTNSKSLIRAFGSGKFSCTKGNCGTRKDGKHIVGVQDLQDRCAAYPPPMCSFIARMISADVLIKQRERMMAEHASRENSGSGRSSRRGSNASGDSSSTD